MPLGLAPAPFCRHLPEFVSVSVDGVFPGLDPDITGRPSGRVVVAMPDATADALAHVLARLGRVAEALDMDRLGVGPRLRSWPKRCLRPRKPAVTAARPVTSPAMSSPVVRAVRDVDREPTSGRPDDAAAQAFLRAVGKKAATMASLSGLLVACGASPSSSTSVETPSTPCHSVAAKLEKDIGSPVTVDAEFVTSVALVKEWERIREGPGGPSVTVSFWADRDPADHLTFCLFSGGFTLKEPPRSTFTPPAGARRMAMLIDSGGNEIVSYIAPKGSGPQIDRPEPL